MAEINRKAFRTTKIKSLKEQKNKAKMPNEGGGGKYSNFHTIEEGINTFRIAPVQPTEPEDAVFFRKVLTTWLECDVEEYKDGEATGKTVVKKKSIFSARLHSSDEEISKEDLLLNYIHFAWKKAKDLYPTDQAEQKKYMGFINGYKDNGKWIKGITYNEAYVGYAWKDDELGRLSLFPKTMSKVEALDMEDDGGDEIANVDILSDVDDGLPVVITRVKGSWDFEVKPLIPSRKEADKFYEKWQLTDSQLEELMSKETLTDLYVDSFKKKDFEMILNGLQRFDEKFEYDIFENDEFLEVVENTALLFANEKEEPKEKVETKKETPKKADKVIEAPVEDEENEGVDFEDMTSAKLKKYMRVAISELNGGDDILDIEDEKWSFPRKKGELIELCEKAEKAEFIFAHLNIEEDDSDEDEEEVEAPKETETVTKKASSARTSFKDRLNKDK